MAIAGATGCDKGEPSADKSPVEAGKTAPEKTATKGAAVVVEDKKPTTVPKDVKTAPPAGGLTSFKSADHKFSVMVVSGTQQKTPMVHEDKGVKVEAISYNFTLANKDALAMVANMTATTKGEYDLEVGLDGAVSQGIARVKGLISKSGKEPYKGRPARQFEFSAKWQGASLEGLGRAVGIEDRRVLMIFAVWPKGKAAAEAASRAFVKSFEAEP